MPDTEASTFLPRTMPGNIPPKRKREKRYQIRNVPEDLQARIAGAAGNLNKGKDEFLVELLTRAMRRFEAHRKEVEGWWDTFETDAGKRKE
jgi:hypothetical protein